MKNFRRPPAPPMTAEVGRMRVRISREGRVTLSLPKTYFDVMVLDARDGAKQTSERWSKLGTDGILGKMKAEDAAKYEQLGREVEGLWRGR